MCILVALILKLQIEKKKELRHNFLTVGYCLTSATDESSVAAPAAVAADAVAAAAVVAAPAAAAAAAVPI